MFHTQVDKGSGFIPNVVMRQLFSSVQAVIYEHGASANINVDPHIITSRSDRPIDNGIVKASGVY